MKAMEQKETNRKLIQKSLENFLLAYHSTPHSTTGKKPASLFLRTDVRTRFDLMRPSIEDKVQNKQAEQKGYHDKNSKQRGFTAGEEVMAQNNTGTKRLPDVMTKRIGPESYEVKVGDPIWRRHIDQIIARSEGETTREEEYIDLGNNENDTDTNVELEEENQAPPNPDPPPWV